MKTCPYCAGEVPEEAARCPHCDADLRPPAPPAPSAPPAGLRGLVGGLGCGLTLALIALVSLVVLFGLLLGGLLGS